MLTATSLAALAPVRHAFFTRNGGISGGIYASLNCGLGSKDDRAAVAANRARAAAALGIDADRLFTPHQVHGTGVAIVRSSDAGGQRPKADAMVTSERGIVVAVGTADCAPVLFADAQAGVVGAAHAGWRGAFAGILEATIAAMESLGARRGHIRAAIGPTISARSYEVGPEFIATFTEADASNARFFQPSGRPGHAMFDLPGYILSRLALAGIEAENLDRCTYAEEDSFFSYRRASHRGEPDYGRLLSAILLAE